MSAPVPSAYQQGIEAGKRFGRDCRKQMRRAIGPDGRQHDLLELAADGFVPDDLLAQINERVPLEAREEYTAGFRAGARLWRDEQVLGMGEN